MAATTLDELVEHELEDGYAPEHRRFHALQTLARQGEGVEDALLERGEETEGHAERIGEDFHVFGEPPEDDGALDWLSELADTMTSTWSSSSDGRERPTTRVRRRDRLTTRV